MSTQREAIEPRTAIDFIEPLEAPANPYREAALSFVRIISLAISYVTEASEPKSAALGVAFALGLPIVNGKSMRAISRELGLSSGTISNHAKTFLTLADLPPSHLMKPETSCAAAKAARETYLQKNA